MYNSNGNIVSGGTYAITEQGDLGLGLTPVDEGVIKTEDDKEKNQKGKKDE